MWRPNDWDKQIKAITNGKWMLPPNTDFPILIQSSLEFDLIKRNLFEAGADAMLEGLLSAQTSFTAKVFENLRKGSAVEIETPPLSAIRKQIGSGKWVFVPDEKE